MRSAEKAVNWGVVGAMDIGDIPRPLGSVYQLAVSVLTAPNAYEFCRRCFCLDRGIDYAVANSEIPGRVKDLPRLLKQVCQQNTDALLQAAIMVLMISVKNACKSGWFPTEDSAELLTLADEIGSNFCTVRDMNTEASNSLDIISTVMAR
ncbi:hypothetical protein RHGRI_005920 [Rhododendron griersonianum]|nr:hypothetical protein RHGRI_005920 [Rhododendron griersonianum]KAG5563333.1 hypothetical protein RHGRI_005920 [Rhododendron griersonianum]